MWWVVTKTTLLKSLESYRLVECEELQGSNVSAFGDDFTVATALEDLEFVFSVVTSTEKVRVQRSSYSDIIVML